MSPSKKSEPADSPGVLSSLPRTRPQRASPRRAAARKAAAAGAAATTRPSAVGAKRVRSAPKRTAGPPPSERAPRQGFECEGERANGSVQPPGGAELVAGAAELIGELAKAGISTGERLFKDVLSRLPLS
ncbi:MAG TPA: hypothetical protein VK691_11180 [Solirubrobacteraceae bacterium]|jgi:hypothetical protein|nr:hypothetical protein [Solirubrobacteraceae bacterium]